MIDFLSAEEKNQVSEAVRAAEAKTSGEIITMIVRRSSMLGHVVPQLLSLIIIFILLLRIIIEQFFHELPYEWIMIIGLILAAPLSLWFQRYAFIQRMLTPISDLSFEVFERAKLEFYESNIHKAKQDTGVLIFISLMERQCIVLAGEAIAKKMPKDTWQEVVSMAVTGIKNKKTAEGLVSAVELCGNILAQHYPLQPGDKNEFPDAVIIKE